MASGRRSQGGVLWDVAAEVAWVAVPDALRTRAPVWASIRRGMLWDVAAQLAGAVRDALRMRWPGQKRRQRRRHRRLRLRFRLRLRPPHRQTPHRVRKPPPRRLPRRLPRHQRPQPTASPGSVLPPVWPARIPETRCR